MALQMVLRQQLLGFAISPLDVAVMRQSVRGTMGAADRGDS
jgi:hypothetical protein